MKKTYFLLYMILAAHVPKAKACDICGCSSGNYFIGPFPQFNEYFIGTRYSFRNFNTVLKTDNSQFSRDFYQTMELWGGKRIGEKWQLLLFAPYNINNSVSDDGTRKNNGFGDITIMLNYNLLAEMACKKDSGMFNQQLWIGGGVKAPSGKFAADSSEIISSANDQPGTGSLDFLFSATYALQLRSWGVSCNMNYKMNGAADNFRFGNHFSASAFAFRLFNLSEVSVSPNFGLLYENLALNKYNNEIVEQTGGNVLLGALGIEARYNKIGVGCNLQLPLAQNLSDSQTNTIFKGNGTFVIYVLTKNI